MFTWIPIHRDAIHPILEYRGKEKELLTVLREMEKKGLKVISLQDEDQNEQKFPLAVIDPFTFLASFNRGITDENRKENWRFLKTRWNLNAAVPEDFTGIPKLHNMSSWLFPYASKRLSDLFARVLINGTNHLIKRGFDRGYISQHEWTGRLRGRICFQEAIRRNATSTSRLPCDFDEMSYNVLHNQILKATMRRLMRIEGLAPECAEALAHHCRIFSDIHDIE